MAGEFDFIQWLKSQQRSSHLVQLPAGDDLAVLRWPADELLLVGVDQVLDGVHFNSQIHSPRQIGAKVMNRNLSDCAAMACLPAAAVIAAGLPRGASLDYAKELYLGMKGAGERFGCTIVGGDTGSWAEKLVLSVTILGRSAGIAPITRGGAHPGHGIYVTGALGGSILGRHMNFVPRVSEGRALGQSGVVTAMIDLSDGLSRDLRHICEQSGIGAVVDAAAVPIHADAEALSKQDGRPAIEHALHDGEDHELLFAASSPPQVEFEVRRIGEFTAEQGIWLQQADGGRTPLVAAGWEHRL